MLKPIKSETDYNKALERINFLMDKPKSKSEDDEFEIIATLIEKYEEEHYPIEFPDPVEAIKFRMEQDGLEQSDISKILGGRNRASEILNKKRKLSLSMIRSLYLQLKIPPESLIKEYKISKKKSSKRHVA